MSDAISVEIIDVAGPMIVASSGFLATLATVESTVAALKITDAASAQEAANIQSRLTTAAKTLDTQRKAPNKPFDDQITAINNAAKGPAARIQQAKDSVARALTQYTWQEAQRVQEENKKRQAELQALQEQQRKEREEADRKAAEAAKAVVPDDDWGEPVAPVVAAPTETEKKIAAIQQAPVPVPVKPAGVSLRTTLKAIVVDLNQVPAMFVERAIKMRAIESTYCVRWKSGDPLPVCEGIRFEIDTKTVSTGRQSHVQTLRKN